MLAAAPDARADTLRVTYVGGTDIWSGVFPMAAAALGPTTGPVALDGIIQFRPTGTSFTFTLDDIAVPDRTTVPVLVTQSVGSRTTRNRGCLAVGVGHSFAVMARSTTVTVHIGGPATMRPGTCDAPATTGTATITWR